MRIWGVLQSLFMLLVLFSVPLVSVAQVSTPVSAPGLEEAVEWLVTRQAVDGSFAGFSGEPDAGTTGDAALALAAAGTAGIEVAVPLANARDFLLTEGAANAGAGPGQTAKLYLALVAAGGDPASIEGDGLAASLTTGALPTGLYGTGVFDHALILLALVAAGETVPDGAISALREARIEDGSWAYDGATTPGSGDSNTTALVVQAIVAARLADDPMVTDAFAYLAQTQSTNGGFAFNAVEPLVPDANSTAIVLQAAIAAGEDLNSTEWRAASEALRRFQNQSGAFRYNDSQPEDNLFATVQAIPALAGVAFPLRPASTAATPGAG